MSNVRQSVATKAKRKGKGQAFDLNDKESDGEVEIVIDIGMSSLMLSFLDLLTSSP